MERHNDLNSLKIAVIGFLGAVLTLAAILALQVLYYTASNRLTEERVIQAATTPSDTQLAEQAVQLTRYDWIDRDKKQLMIPVDLAMELVVQELSAAPGEERNP
jgi:hypothetical protein